MNEFTKEELLQIRHALHFTQIQDWAIGIKIQAMIDNYCEHNTLETSALIDYCHKCDKAEFKSL